MRAELSREARGDGLLKKDPNMPAVAGTRPLDSGRYIQALARFKKCGGILFPGRFVKICCEKEAGLIKQHRIDSCHERSAALVLSAKVPADHVISDRIKAAMRTLRTFNSRLFANSRNPFIRACRRITGTACPAIFKTPRVHVIAASQQGAEQCDLRLRGRAVIDRIYLFHGRASSMVSARFSPLLLLATTIRL